jgi:hypothetical protein
LYRLEIVGFSSSSACFALTKVYAAMSPPKLWPIKIGGR